MRCYIFNIKTKQNQMKRDETEKKNLKQREINNKRIIINFFLHYLFIKIILLLLFS